MEGKETNISPLDGLMALNHPSVSPISQGWNQSMREGAQNDAPGSIPFDPYTKAKLTSVVGRTGATMFYCQREREKKNLTCCCGGGVCSKGWGEGSSGSYSLKGLLDNTL